MVDVFIAQRIVAGIIVSAVADELVLSHPLGHTDLATVLVIGFGLLALVAAAAPIASPLVLSACTAASLIVVAVWEWVSLATRPGSGASHGGARSDKTPGKPGSR